MTESSPNYQRMIDDLMTRLYRSTPILRVAAAPNPEGSIRAYMCTVIKTGHADDPLVAIFGKDMKTPNHAGFGNIHHVPVYLETRPDQEVRSLLREWLQYLSAWRSNQSIMAAIGGSSTADLQRVPPYHTKLLPLYSEALGWARGAEQEAPKSCEAAVVMRRRHIVALRELMEATVIAQSINNWQMEQSSKTTWPNVYH